MQPTDTYEDRTKMVDMHNDIINRIDIAMQEKRYIEACWFCYSCFESRICRTLEKISVHCPKQRCRNNPRFGIKRRIECVQSLNWSGYLGPATFDNQTLGSIKKWCKERDQLTHGLLTLENHAQMNKAFFNLAIEGKPLVQKLYAQTTAFRNWYYQIDALMAFPDAAAKKCYK